MKLVHYLLDAITSTTANGVTTKTVADSSGNNRHGTCTDITIVTDTKFGNCASFNGTSSRIAYSELTCTTYFTFAAWVKKSADMSSGWCAIIEFGDHSPYLGYYAGIPRLYTSTSATADPGTDWHHVAVTQGMTETILYVNGSVVATGKRVTCNGVGFGIGKNVNDDYFKGSMADVVIYDEELSQSAIRSLAGQDRLIDALQARMKFLPPAQTTLQGQITALTTNMTTLEGKVETLTSEKTIAEADRAAALEEKAAADLARGKALEDKAAVELAKINVERERDSIRAERDEALAANAALEAEINKPPPPARRLPPSEETTTTTREPASSVPIGDFVRSVATAVADAQFKLDRSSVMVAEFMSGFYPLRDGATGELVNSDGQFVNNPVIVDSRVQFGHRFEGGKRVPNLLSMMELGFVPNFYQFVDTIIEVRLALQIEKTGRSVDPTTGRVVETPANVQDLKLSTTPVDASYAGGFNYKLDMASMFKTKLVCVPPPSALEERLREVMRQESLTAAQLETSSTPELPAETPV